MDFRSRQQWEIDQALDGHLDEELIRRRDAGETYAAIAEWITAETGIEITGRTVNNWVDALVCNGPGQ